MPDLQLTWTEDELLAGHDVVEPLVAGGVRCHGGFDADGCVRVAAHAQPCAGDPRPGRSRTATPFGTEILDAPLELWPEVFPNVAQSKYLLREGVREPTISSLTRIGTVEGFGGLIRAVKVDDMQSHFDESIGAPRSSTCSAGCSRRTRATKPAGKTKAATSRCGSRRATSRSSTRCPTT